MCALAVLAAVAAFRPSSPNLHAQTAVTTFLGGGVNDYLSAIAVDAQSNIYVAGYSTNGLPRSPNAVQRSMHGPGDAFVAKFNAAGTLAWATYLGGSDLITGRFSYVVDKANAIAVDPQGNVYVAGSTASADFPTVNAFQSSRRSTSTDTDAFLAKIDPTGSRLIYSTYFGGVNGSTSIEALTVGPAGEVWAGVRSTAQQLPVTRSLSTDGTLIVAKFQPGGMPWWVTRVGHEGGRIRLAADASGRPIVIRESSVVQLDPSGASTTWSWSMPGSGLFDLASGPDGSVVVVGSAANPLTLKNAWQPEFDPAGNGFVAILNSSGTPDLVSYLSGASAEAVADVDGAGGVHIAFDFVAATRSASGGAVPLNPDGPMFTSTDRGDSWTWSSTGLLGAGIRELAIDRNGVVLAMATDGVYRSFDAGASWSLWRRLPSTLNSVIGAFDPRDPSTLYYLEAASGLWRVDLQTGALTSARFGQLGWYCMAVSPHDGSVWLGTNDGVEVSTDRGVTWTRRNRGFPPGTGGSIAAFHIDFDRRRPGVVYARVQAGLLRSVDDGLSWELLTTLSTSSLAFDPSDSNRIYAGTFSDGIHVSTDGGRTWTRTTAPYQIRALTISDAPPFPLYAAATQSNTQQRAIILTSSDRAVTWQTARHADMRAVPVNLLPSPGDPNRVYAASGVVGSAPYVMRMDRRSFAAPMFTRSFSSAFTTSGRIVDVAATFDGQTIVAVSNPAAGLTILRIGR